MRRRFEDLIEFCEVFVELEDGSDVTTAVAVIGRGPDRHERIVEHLLVTLHDQLMGSANQVDRVLSVKLLYDFSAEKVTSSAWTYHPAWDVIGVTPH